MALGCGGPPDPGPGKDSGTDDLELSIAIRPPPSQDMKLVRLADIEADRPVQVTVQLTAGKGPPREIEFTEMASQQELEILGLRFETTYDVSLVVTDEDGKVTELDDVAVIDADVPPPIWPKIQLGVIDPPRMEPGNTLIAINAQDNSPNHFILVLDDRGSIVWFYRAADTVLDARVSSTGNLLALIGGELVELDWIGNELNRWSGPQELHHEAAEMPNGSLLSMNSRVVSADNYPTNYDNPGPRQQVDVLDHTVIELAPDGSPVGEWSLWDVLDQGRIGYDALEPENGNAPKDWAHANAAVYDPVDDAFLVSIRHQDAVVKISRATGELIWILAPPENWAPPYQPFLLTSVGGDTEWPYHPHAPEIGPNGKLLLFDNGNRRVSPFDGLAIPPLEQQYSRVVEYEIDEDAMTVRQIWELVDPGGDTLFSYATGDANNLPQTGNVLAVYGVATAVNGVLNEDLGRGQASARFVEVTRSKEVVFDMLMYSDIQDSRQGWHGYRAVRMPRFYH